MKKLLVILLLLPTPAFAAIAFDNASSSVYSAATASIIGFSVAATNPGIFVAQQLNSGNDNGAGCTFNGIAMTQFAKVHDTHAGNATWWYVHFLLGNSGVHDVVCTQNVDTNAMRVIAQSYTGVNQSMSFGVTDTVTVETATTSPSVSIATTPTTANSWLGTFGLQFTNQKMVAGQNTTLRSTLPSPRDAFFSGGDSNTALSASTTQTWINSDVSNADWSMVQFSISPAGAAAATAPPLQTIFFGF